MKPIDTSIGNIGSLVYSSQQIETVLRIECCILWYPLRQPATMETVYIDLCHQSDTYHH